MTSEQTGNRNRLSPTQVRILDMKADGMGSAEVATEIGISKRTVDWYLNMAYQLLQVTNLVQALRKVGRVI